MFNTDYFKVVFIITSKCFNEPVFHFSRDFLKKFFFPFHIDFPATFLNVTVMHFYGLFRKLSSTSQPHLSSCLLGVLWGESSLGLIPHSFSHSPHPRPCAVLISICQSSHRSYLLLSSYFFKNLPRIESTRFVILSNLWVISIGKQLNVLAFLWLQTSPSRHFPSSSWISPAWQGPLPYCFR